MRPVRTFTVIPAMPPSLARLQDLAYNLRWSWSHATIDLFRRLDPDLWEGSGHASDLRPVASSGGSQASP